MKFVSPTSAMLALSFLSSNAHSAVLAQAASDSGNGQSVEPVAPREEETTELRTGEIVVTAQRRSQSLEDVPLAISVLTGDDLIASGVTQSQMLESISPSLQISSAYGDAQPNFTLRGIGVGNEYNANQASPVGVYTDDAYLAFRTTHGMQIFDLDRVEVLRGPQGTLYGRNTTGGAINFISRKPSLDEATGYVDIGYGSYNTVRAQGAIDLTVIPDRLGIRSSVNFVRGDGWVENLTPGGLDGNSSNSIAARSILRARPSEDLDITLRLHYNRANPSQVYIYGLGVGDDGYNPVLDYDRSHLDFDQQEINGRGRSFTKDAGGLLNVSLSLSDTLDLTLMSSYLQGKSDIDYDCDGSPVDACAIRFYKDFNQTNQEARLTYSAPGTSLQFGGYYGHDSLVSKDNYRFFAYTGAGLFAQQEFEQARESKAVFAQLDQEVATGITVTAGLRYTWDSTEYRDGRAFYGIPESVPTDYLADDPNYIPVTYTIGSAEAPLPTLIGRDGALTGRFAINYQFDSGAIVYGSYSRGYRSGAFTGQGYESPDTIAYVEPEEVDAFELGAKGRLLDNRLFLATALFYNRYTNQQLNERIGTISYLRNAGSSEIYGIEVEGWARLTDALRAKFSLGLLHSEYKELSLSGVDLSGNRLPFAPGMTGNMELTWRVGAIAGGNLTFSPEVRFQGKTFFTPENADTGNLNMQEDSWVMADASLAWEGENLTARLWVNNIFNKRTFIWGTDMRGFGLDYLVPDAPRTYGASVRLSF